MRSFGKFIAETGNSDNCHMAILFAAQKRHKWLGLGPTVKRDVFAVWKSSRWSRRNRRACMVVQSLIRAILKLVEQFGAQRNQVAGLRRAVKFSREAAVESKVHRPAVIGINQAEVP